MLSGSVVSPHTSVNHSEYSDAEYRRLSMKQSAPENMSLLTVTPRKLRDAV